MTQKLNVFNFISNLHEQELFLQKLLFLEKGDKIEVFKCMQRMQHCRFKCQLLFSTQFEELFDEKITPLLEEMDVLQKKIETFEF